MVGDGWTVLDRNWRCKLGELDIVAQRGGVLRFVEVKARQPGAQVDLEAVDHNKQRKLVRAADSWLLDHDDSWSEMAFSVALVDLREWSVEWIHDAFDA